MTPSGVVPRQLAAGVTWDQGAENEYQEQLAALLESGRYSAEMCAREALWAVEGQLHRSFYRSQVMRANRCSSPFEKRTLFAEWMRDLGRARANSLARVVKDEKANKAALSW